MKFTKFMLCVAVAGILAAPLPAAAQDSQLVFKPTGQWSLDYGDDYCRLARTFSDGTDELALAIERIEPGPMARLILVSNGIKPRANHCCRTEELTLSNRCTCFAESCPRPLAWFGINRSRTVISER